MEANYNYSITDSKVRSISESTGIDSAWSSECVVLPRKIQELFKILDYLKTIDDNWNGFGARKPYGLAIEIAQKLIESLRFRGKCHPDEISPDGEGGITVKWFTDNESILVNIVPGLLHLAHDYADHRQPEFINSVVYQGENSIPQQILRHLPNRKD